MRRSLAAILLCFVAFLQPAAGQYYYHNSRYYEGDVNFELGVSGGIMNALTDLGGNR